MAISATTPLFSLCKNEFQQTTKKKVKRLDVYSAQKVVLIFKSKSKEIEIKPEELPNHDCLKAFQWTVSASEDTYHVKAFEVNSHAKGKTKEVKKIKLTKDEKKLLKEHLDFFQENYNHKESQGVALGMACEAGLRYSKIPNDPNLHVQLLEILLFKINVNPNLTWSTRPAFEYLIHLHRKQINEQALQLLFKAGFLHKNIPLYNLVVLNSFSLFKECVEKGADLYRVTSHEQRISKFFVEVDKIENNQIKVPFFHSVILNLSLPGEYFAHLKTLSNLSVNKPDEEGKSLIMSLLNFPDQYAERLTWLLTLKPDMTVIDYRKRTALFHLLMSTDASSFKKYFHLLLDHGLNLNEIARASLNQFHYCIKLLVDLNYQHPELTIWEDKDLIQKVIMMRDKSTQTKLPDLLYNELPQEIRTIFENHS